MSLRWVRLALGALLAEIVPIMILVGLVAALGPTDLNEAQTFAGTLGRCVGPIGGAVATFLVAFWVARSQPSQPLRHGIALGALTAGLDVAILIGERPPFEVLFLFSNVGRVAAGALGGYLAASSSRTTG